MQPYLFCINIDLMFSLMRIRELSMNVNVNIASQIQVMDNGV